MSGHVYKRCGCPVQRDAAGKRINCPRTHGSWYFVANLPAEGPNPRRQHTKGGFTTRRDAEQALRTFLATVDQGQVVLPTKITFEQYIDSWLEAVEPSLSATTVSNYRIIVRCYLRPQLGFYRLTSLRPDHFIKAYRALLTSGGKGGRPLSATTVRTAHRIASKALNDAVRDGLMHRNPAAHIPLPKQVRPELQVWDRAQVAAFLEVAVSDRLRAAWLLALLCGLRRGELAGLRWTDVDLEMGVVRIASQRTTDAEWRVITKEPKGTSRRSIDLGPVLLAALTAHRHANEEERRQHGLTGDQQLVFVQPDGKGYHPDRLRELFQAVAKRAEVPIIRLHDARHSCATLALDAGLHPKVVQQLLGHSSWNVTMDLYSHRVDRLQREASRRLEEHVQEVLSS
jgi:integrase